METGPSAGRTAIGWVLHKRELATGLPPPQPSAREGRGDREATLLFWKKDPDPDQERDPLSPQWRAEQEAPPPLRGEGWGEGRDQGAGRRSSGRSDRTGPDERPRNRTRSPRPRVQVLAGFRRKAPTPT